VLTVAESKKSRLKRVCGVCVDSQDFLDLLNDSTRELMRRGSWWTTVKTLRGCIYNGCITWPRAVGTTLAFNRCGSSPVKNYWYQYDAVLPGSFSRWWNNGQFLCARDIALADHGTSPVFNQIPCLNDRYLQFFITDQGDAGKTITIFGLDGNGQEIITKRSDGTIQPGVVLTLAIPFVQTPMLIRRVDRVIKDQTLRPVYGYQFDGSHLFPLAYYQPSETLPQYRTSRLITSQCQQRNCDQWPSQISALVKLEFIPVQDDDDQVLIDNVDALAMAFQSIKLGDAYDPNGRDRLMLNAVRELNHDLRTKFPIDETPVRVKPFGTADLRRDAIGQLM
jgi:hypothetical protein